MALKVVGAGFGRTGTLSLKNALEKVGYGPCYHMREVFPRPDHVKMWLDAALGKRVDWDLLFRNFVSTVDWPSARWWKELAAHHPDSKVVLSLHDPESWYKSMSETIYQPMTWPVPDDAPEIVKQQNQMARKAILADTFDNRFEDKDHAIAVFNRHNQEVRDTVDPKRLLVFEARMGWEPLCKFLEVPTPNEPYPQLNDTASTQAMIIRMREVMGQAVQH
jgi:hypothetical protein